MNDTEMLAKRGNGGQLRSWDPWQTLHELQRDMSQLWERAWPGRSALAPWPMPEMTEAEAWLPSTDVYEKDGQLVVKADLPGMKRDDVSVEIINGDLQVKGERRHEEEVRREDYYRSERSYGSFFRRIPLPADVKADDIQARFDNGVLEVRVPLPTVEAETPVKIAVN
jgi:HSP20 family protein